jgi:hypothetical protein
MTESEVPSRGVPVSCDERITNQQRFMKFPRVTNPQSWGALLLLWITSLVVFGIALSPLARVGLINDDLVVLIGGLGDSSRAGSFIQLITETVASHSNGTHFAPISGILTVCYVKIAEFLSFGPLSLVDAWGLLRVLVLEGAVLTAAWALATSRQTFQLARITFGRDFLTVFALMSACSIVFLQVHGLWSNDPVVSYPIAGFFSAILFFGTWASTMSAANRSGRGRLLYLTLATSLGILGVLNYEMVAGPLVVLLIAMLLAPNSSSGTRFSIRNKALLSISSLVPLVVFVFYQVLRLSQTKAYSGTQSGHLDWVLPVWMNSLLSSLPTTVGTLVDDYAPRQSISWLDVTLRLLCVIVLLAVSRLSIGARGGKISRMSRHEFPGILSILFIFSGTALTSTLIFAVSSKYQTEIGVVLGHVYLFYAMTLLALSGVAVTFFLALDSRFPRASWLLILMLLIPIGTVTASYDSRSIQQLDSNSTWSRDLITSLDVNHDSSTRCERLDRVAEMGLPAWYFNTLINGVQDIYKQRYRSNYCNESEFLGLPRNLNAF